jgi:ABC-type dipeptide/oligopeptide/nickel transport system permease subunit
LTTTTANAVLVGRKLSRRAPSTLGRVLLGTWRKTSGRVAIIAILLLTAAAILAPVIAPHDPSTQDLYNINQPPAWLGGSVDFFFGTDSLGRDVLSRILYGLQLSLAIGVGAATLAAMLGLVLGLLAGYYERGLGAVLMRIADMQFAIPFTAVGISIAAVFGPGVLALLLILGVWGWTTYARTIASTVAQTRRLDFVTAARTLGASTGRIIVKHIAPNVIGPVIILWSTMAGVLVLAESALSLLGLGVQLPLFSLGTILSEAQVNLRVAPWAVIAPGLFLLAIILAFNTLGDALRDVLDPSSSKVIHNPKLV